jgi:uncharacterized LabA/DUF88 family protein
MVPPMLPDPQKKQRRTVRVYVDGFALYKGLLQRRYPELKWLDLRALSTRLFPDRDVTGVTYFTAQLKPTTNDPGVGQRQKTYLRALEATGVVIVTGTFHFARQYLPLHPEQLDQDGKVVTVCVKRPEEKGTDVALATQLVVDAFDRAADSYAVVTNDSDLVPPVQVLSDRGIDVSLVSVAEERYNKAFAQAGISGVRQIRRGVLESSQLPRTIVDAQGRTIRKPPTWP